jgi:hypothetical protein
LLAFELSPKVRMIIRIKKTTTHKWREKKCLKEKIIENKMRSEKIEATQSRKNFVTK